MNHLETPIILAAGGTGGHIFPAEALGAELKARGYNNIYMVTDERFAKYCQNFEDIPVKTIKTGSLSGNFLQRVRGGYRIIAGLVQARKFMKNLGGPVVIGFGGYPSFPTMLAALSLRLKIIIHEQNSLAGMVNKMLAEFVNVVAVSYLPTRGFSASVAAKICHTGNPVRAAVMKLRDASYPQFAANDKIKILVTGGSQGASIFGLVVPEAIALLPENIRSRISIDQQTRQDDLEKVKARYLELDVDALVAPFFSDMAERLAASHLLVCRAGASTIAELFTAGRPAILVPFAAAKDDHQSINADFAAQKGAAWIIKEKDFTATALAAMLESFINNPASLAEAAAKAKESGNLNSAAKLADIVEELARR